MNHTDDDYTDVLISCGWCGWIHAADHDCGCHFTA